MIRRIFFYPIQSSFNRYVALQLDILRGICDDIVPITQAGLPTGRQPRTESVAILNWYEDRLAWQRDKPNSVLLKSILLLIALKISCGRLIWVRHNFWPHDLPRRYFRQHILLFCLRALTTVTVTHRRVKGMSSRIAPHPLYYEGDLSEAERDIDFLYFGTIKRYKGLSALLDTWPPGRRLVIAGAAPDRDLLAQLEQQAIARGLDIQFLARFLPDEELESLLVRTRFVVLPHDDNAMIVTGSFFHAVSFGANILAKRGDFSDSLRADYSFVTVYDERDMDQTLARLRYVEADAVVAEVRKTNGSERCREAWRDILEG